MMRSVSLGFVGVPDYRAAAVIVIGLAAVLAAAVILPLVAWSIDRERHADGVDPRRPVGCGFALWLSMIGLIPALFLLCLGLVLWKAWDAR